MPGRETGGGVGFFLSSFAGSRTALDEGGGGAGSSGGGFSILGFSAAAGGAAGAGFTGSETWMEPAGRSRTATARGRA